MTFSDISLLQEELRLLRSLKRHSRTLTKQEQDISGPLLGRFHFIQAEQDMLYSITKEGRRYLRFCREDAFRHRWPVYLAIASFVVSAFSLVISLSR